ncbi:MAG: hypothetical protein ABGX04_14560 [Myxococcales bacterium]|nr:hypothetical protein [Myxococcales bacterium]HIL80906.1 hypothetical protein [Myxococcales bacterium]
MRKFEPSFHSMPFVAFFFGCAVFFLAASATAGIHTWDVVEVFSNSDGTIQYVELLDLGTTGAEVGVGNGSLSSTAHSFSWANGTVTGPTNGKSYLIATAGFAALPGAPTPDVIIPPANVPFFNTGGDTVSFAGVDSFAFGPVPTNGLDSFDSTTGSGTNSPKNYAGDTGTVDASGGPSAPAAPSASAIMLVMLCVSLMLIATYAISRQNFRPTS